MTNEKVERLYRTAAADNTFRERIWEADGDSLPPGIYVPSELKTIVASMYYGYIVALYGKHWKEHLVQI